MQPKISVVIPAYNAAATVAAAVDSARAQTYAPLEILVVDDGSSDDTAAAAERAGARVLRQENAGVSAARNRAILESQGDFIAFLDADDRWLPEKLARQTAALGRYPYAAVIFCDMLRESAGAIENTRWFVDRKPYRDAEKTALGDGVQLLTSGAISAALLAENFMPTSSMLVRKNAIAPPGFDTSMAYCEDLDLWLRIVRDGDALALEEPLVVYTLHADSASAQWQHILRGNITLYERIHSASDNYHASLLPLIPARMTAAFHELGEHLVRSGDPVAGRVALRRALDQEFSARTAAWYLLGVALALPGVDALRSITKRG